MRGTRILRNCIKNIRKLKKICILGSLEGPLEVPWGSLERALGVLGVFWGSWECILGPWWLQDWPHGPTWGQLEASLGPTWDQLGANFGPAWLNLGPFGCQLGSIEPQLG